MPWLIAIFHLNQRDKKLIPLIAPFASASAFLINEIWFYYDFGELHPFTHPKTLNAAPFNLGLYPIIGCYMIYFLKKSKRPYLTIFLLSLLITFCEFTFLLSEKIVYANGWNIYWTFFAYLAAFLVGYWFYLYLKKIDVID